MRVENLIFGSIENTQSPKILAQYQNINAGLNFLLINQISLNRSKPAELELFPLETFLV